MKLVVGRLSYLFLSLQELNLKLRTASLSHYFTNLREGSFTKGFRLQNYLLGCLHQPDVTMI